MSRDMSPIDINARAIELSSFFSKKVFSSYERKVILARERYSKVLSSII
jgi:hypothetical protein